MHYELNVSKDGQHVFATHPRSVTTEREAARLYVLFEQAFPEKDGFKTDCTKYQDSGTSVNPTHFPVAFREDVWATPSLKHTTVAEREAMDKNPRAGYGDTSRLMSSEERAEQERAHQNRTIDRTYRNPPIVR